MRYTCLALIALALLATSRPALAQRSWVLSLGVSRDAFTGASSDTIIIPGTRVEVTPSPRIALDVGIGRASEVWEVLLLAGYAGGSLRAKTDALLLDDRTGGVNRWRIALQVGRRLARLGEASLAVVVGPALEHWTSTGIGNRTTLSGRAGVALRIPLGAITFENSALLGIGGSPWRLQDLAPGASTHALRTWSFGAGFRVRL